jgi:hypothetical protein
MSIQSFRANHPRRAQVNDRLANQSQRIENGVANGQITRDQAKQLHQQDRFVRQEERTMASENTNGHLTRAEHKSLNTQLNALSQDIFERKHGA